MAWSDSYTSSQSFMIAHAEAYISDVYGRTVSVERKNKVLDKFGQNLDLDAADGAAVVSTLGVNETLQTSNAITHITDTTGRAEIALTVPFVIPSNCDVRMTADTDTDNAQVTAHISGYLAVDIELADAVDPDPA